jgi:programmed cell death protein 4
MSSPVAVASNRNHLHDHGTKLAVNHHKNVGHHGSVKKVIEKRGGVGRGAWGKPGSAEVNAPKVLNRSDPNFDEYEDGNVVIDDITLLTSGDLRKMAVQDILVEYIESGDVKEALYDLNLRKYIEGADFVEACLGYGIDHHAYERELISQLLSAAHPIFEGRGYEEGFQRVLYNLPDVTLDVPNAAEFVGLFAARCMYDDVLPPKFIKDAIVENEQAKLAVSLAFNMENNPAERSRLENVWGPASLHSVDRLRDEVNVILKEYLVSLDVNEADRAIVELNSPSFMSQVVKQAIYMGIESGNHRPRELILALLKSWVQSSILSEYHLFHGFELAVRNIDEIKLDVPRSEEILNQIIGEAKKLGLLTSSFTADGNVKQQ